MKRDHQESCGVGGGIAGYDTKSGNNKGESSSSMGKGKLWEEEQDPGGMDELLAVLGYKVRSSDMADVAQKLEQLEMVMGTAQEDGISYLCSDTVHYNPSDLSGWVQSMLSELNPPMCLDASGMLQNQHDPVLGSSTVTFSNPLSHKSEIFSGDYDCDLRAIPGNLSEPSRPVVLIDSQETGVRLVHTLLACAQAVQLENLKLAEALVKHIGLLAASQASAMRKVATYFAEALARRIYKIYPQECLDPTYSDALEMHFYETCPYLKFAHFTANQAILEAFATASRVHVIDFGLKQGMQWPALMQALALRPGGPPAFRLTGIGPPQPNNTDTLQQFSGSPAGNARPPAPEEETVAVNSVFELHRLLARPGGIDKVLSSVKAMKPKIVTIVEQEANHNGPVFLDRFTEALHYYSSLFDSLEGSGLAVPSQDLVMSELYLGRQICNVVACEGADRVERHETLTHWRTRIESSGFDPVHLGSNAFKQASMLLALFAGGDGYRVEENNGCLLLGWHTRPLIATSAGNSVVSNNNSTQSGGELMLASQ
ncbi:hypothetical protein GH714_013907 [Hevea brasiliensis]|uniref:DELLA protein n=1 Tax=Hevea brasiliensis TaxID=3981 RepID=A0A6A6LIX9_HEVBR|nr:hypothetical protein GH714_013907 [Hevea brasiliensis]